MKSVEMLNSVLERVRNVSNAALSLERGSTRIASQLFGRVKQTYNLIPNAELIKSPRRRAFYSTAFWTVQAASLGLGLVSGIDKNLTGTLIGYGLFFASSALKIAKVPYRI